MIETTYVADSKRPVFFLEDFPSSVFLSFFLFLVYLESILAKLDCSRCLLLSSLCLLGPRDVNYFWVPCGPLHIPPLKQRSRQKLPNGKEGEGHRSAPRSGHRCYGHVLVSGTAVGQDLVRARNVTKGRRRDG